jgi:hypothetical protein
MKPFPVSSSISRPMDRKDAQAWAAISKTRLHAPGIICFMTFHTRPGKR